MYTLTPLDKVVPKAPFISDGTMNYKINYMPGPSNSLSGLSSLWV